MLSIVFNGSLSWIVYVSSNIRNTLLKRYLLKIKTSSNKQTKLRSLLLIKGIIFLMIKSIGSVILKLKLARNEDKDASIRAKKSIHFLLKILL